MTGCRNLGRSKGKGLKFIDLFSGIGGTRLGFEDDNTVNVFSSEWDKFAVKTYEANFGDKPSGDITQVNEADIPEHDILLAGFPCQPFSSIGKRGGFKDETQGTLFFDILRILDYHKPAMLLLENVPGLLTIDEGRTMETVMGSLDELGYDVQYKVLDSADFGLPQRRKRVYIVGFLKELQVKYEYPEPTVTEHTPISSILEGDVEGYTISKKLQENYLFKKDDGKPQVVDKDSDELAKTLVSTYHKVQRLTGTFVRGGETGLRLLSRNEIKALQGFPLDFKLPVSRTQAYRQLGNSVPVPVVKAVADNMKESLYKSEVWNNNTK